MTFAELFPAFLLGILGSIHCVGMCGGFSLAVSQYSPHRRAFLLRQFNYYLGKTLTYMLLGMLFGGLGAAIGHLFMGDAAWFEHRSRCRPDRDWCGVYSDGRSRYELQKN